METLVLEAVNDWKRSRSYFGFDVKDTHQVRDFQFAIGKEPTAETLRDLFKAAGVAVNTRIDIDGELVPMYGFDHDGEYAYCHLVDEDLCYLDPKFRIKYANQTYYRYAGNGKFEEVVV